MQVRTWHCRKFASELKKRDAQRNSKECPWFVMSLNATVKYCPQSEPHFAVLETGSLQATQPLQAGGV